MIAGRLKWLGPRARIPFRIGLAAIDVPDGALIVTEAGARRRASLQVVDGADALAALDPGGVEVLDAPFDAFAKAVTSESHTLKRALTDPRLLSGIGNAYSDEILHAARLSPLMLTSRLEDEHLTRLHRATVEVLTTWRDRLIREAGDAFPER
jgi:formamidopyrimidine-DNA glycosylase